MNFFRRNTAPKTDSTATTTEVGPKAIDRVSTDLPFNPTRCFFIAKHGGFTQDIKIYDITSSADMSSYPSSLAEKAPVEKWFAQSHKDGSSSIASAPEPFLIVHRNTWYGHTFVGKVGDTEIATLRGGLASSSKNKLVFPAGSKHCEHDITMKVDSYFNFRDEFVVNSVPFTWAVVNGWSMRQFELRRIVGGEKKVCARFWQPHMQVLQGGVIVVDEGEVDVMVALMTAMVMLRKQRQKYYEYS